MKKKTNSTKNAGKNGGIAVKSKAIPDTMELPSTGWKKVKIAGRIMSDEGGAGLEGLLGVEVLDDYPVPIARQKFENVRYLSNYHCSGGRH